MEYTSNIDKGVLKITMKGKFTFTDHSNYKKFFDAIKDRKIETVYIDIGGVDFVDSAALGLFLLTKDEAEKNGKKLHISEPKGQVHKMFEISRFYEIFDIG